MAYQKIFFSKNLSAFKNRDMIFSNFYFFSLIFSISFLLSCQKTSLNQNEFEETEPPILKANYIKVGEYSLGFYSATPAHYEKGLSKYPLIVWIHGNGQIGNGNSDLSKVLYGGIPKLLSDKTFPPSFEVNGKHFSFVILAPQFVWWPSNHAVMDFINYAKRNYRIDFSRIYLVGISMGGIVTADFGAEYTSSVSAIIPISGVSIDDIHEKCINIAKGELPEWIFQNKNDDVFDINNTIKYVSLLEALKSPIPPKYTEFLPFGENGHDAWTMATNPEYRENNMNIYEWMLQFKR